MLKWLKRRYKAQCTIRMGNINKYNILYMELLGINRKLLPKLVNSNKLKKLDK
jgi:hypothetical protein